MHLFRMGAIPVLAVMTIALVLSACQPTASTSPSPAQLTPVPGAPAASPAPSPGIAAASPVASPAAAPAASPAASPAAQAAVAKPTDFPSKPIDLILPFPPGGGFDAQARQLAAALQRIVGQPVVVKNVPGGGQRLGARQFEQSAADGYTLAYFADTNLFVSTFVEPAEGFDLSRWTWVAGVRKLPGLVLVSRDSPFKSMQDVLTAAKAGQRFRMGNNGLGGSLAYSAVFAEAIGIQNVAHVGGFQGTAEMITSLIQGDSDIMSLVGPQVATPFVRSGDVRVLASMQPTRLSIFPDVPTTRELGMPNVDDLEGLGSTTAGIAAPPGAPADRIRYLEQSVLSGLKDPEFLDWARKAEIADTELNPLPAKDFSDGKVREYQFWTKYRDAIRRASS